MRLLLVTHRGLDAGGGGSARWTSLQQRLREHGWEVSVVSPAPRTSGAEYDPAAARAVARRARVMRRVGRASAPAFALAGVRPEAFPPSMAWAPTAARLVAAHVARDRPDVIVATGPPMVALLGARLGHRPGHPPLVVELRDLWAGNPGFDRSGHLLGRLERWVFRSAARVVVCTPEAAEAMRRRHDGRGPQVVSIPNGFEPELLEQRPPRRLPEDRPLTLLHSGTLSEDRTLVPLLAALARAPDRIRLVLHGHVVPAIVDEVQRFGDRVAVERVPPSDHADAVARMAAADATLVVQGPRSGDATAVAVKTYEYLALGKPVLSLGHGGATEHLLRGLGQSALCARQDDPASIERAVTRLRAGAVDDPVPPSALEPWSRAATAAAYAGQLEDVIRS